MHNTVTNFSNSQWPIDSADPYLGHKLLVVVVKKYYNQLVLLKGMSSLYAKKITERYTLREYY